MSLQIKNLFMLNQKESWEQGLTLFLQDPQAIIFFDHVDKEIIKLTRKYGIPESEVEETSTYQLFSNLVAQSLRPEQPLAEFMRTYDSRESLDIWDYVFFGYIRPSLQTLFLQNTKNKQPPRIQFSPKLIDPLPELLEDTLGMTFRLIKPGTFMMGSPETEKHRSHDEAQHQVTLTSPFYMAIHPVTQDIFERVMGYNPSWFKGERLPVEKVSWTEATKFIDSLNSMLFGISSWAYRLPSEAEWEYACRAGTTTAYSFGNSSDELEEFGWFGMNSDWETQPVGGKQPNPWGLHDMHGNIWEWCVDGWSHYPQDPVSDPIGNPHSHHRIARGGCWGSHGGNCRSADRIRCHSASSYNDLGFRLVMGQVNLK